MAIVTGTLGCIHRETGGGSRGCHRPSSGAGVGVRLSWRARWDVDEVPVDASSSVRDVRDALDDVRDVPSVPLKAHLERRWQLDRGALDEGDPPLLLGGPQYIRNLLELFSAKSLYFESTEDLGCHVCASGLR